jgi:hypothetical protein
MLKFLEHFGVVRAPNHAVAGTRYTLAPKGTVSTGTSFRSVLGPTRSPFEPEAVEFFAGRAQIEITLREISEFTSTESTERIGRRSPA